MNTEVDHELEESVADGSFFTFSPLHCTEAMPADGWELEECSNEYKVNKVPKEPAEDDDDVSICCSQFRLADDTQPVVSDQKASVGSSTESSCSGVDVALTEHESDSPLAHDTAPGRDDDHPLKASVGSSTESSCSWVDVALTEHESDSPLAHDTAPGRDDKQPLVGGTLADTDIAKSSDKLGSSSSVLGADDDVEQLHGGSKVEHTGGNSKTSKREPEASDDECHASHGSNCGCACENSGKSDECGTSKRKKRKKREDVVDLTVVHVYMDLTID